MPTMYRTINGANTKVKKRYAVIGGVNTQVKKRYAVINGANTLVYTAEAVLDSINLKTDATTGESSEKGAYSAQLATDGLVTATITGTFSATVTTQRTYNYTAILRFYGYTGSTRTTIKDLIWTQQNGNYSTSVNQSVSVSGYDKVSIAVIIVASSTNPTLSYGQFSNGKIAIV